MQNEQVWTSEGLHQIINERSKDFSGKMFSVENSPTSLTVQVIQYTLFSNVPKCIYKILIHPENIFD